MALTLREIQEILPESIDKPLLARTPHGSYWFTVSGVQRVNETDTVVLVLKEV